MNVAYAVQLVSVWWNPFSWLNDAAQAASEAAGWTMFNLFSGIVEWSLNLMQDLFNASLSALRLEVVLSSAEFDATIVGTLQTLSKMVVLPIAGIMITYMFAHEIYELIVTKNRGGDFSVGDVLLLVVKTSVMITLATHAFSITMGFADLAKWMVDRVPVETVALDYNLTKPIVDSLKPTVNRRDAVGGDDPVVEGMERIPDGEQDKYYYEFPIGQSAATAMVSLVALIGVLFMAGLMYIVAWSRMVYILLYATISPIPMCTLFSSTWFQSIGQNFIKNLLALMLQGFLLLTLMVIYKGLVSRIATLIAAESNPVYNVLMLIVSMAIVVRLMMGTHTFAKSIFGAT